MSNFKSFASIIQANYNKMAADGELYVIENSNDILWTTYLASFPEGSNPIFKERTTHDCNCCRQFIRRIGCVVSIKENKLHSVWDVDFDDHPYAEVTKKLSDLCHSLPVVGVFRTSEHQYGNETTRSMEDGVLKIWEHFEGKILPRHYSEQPGTVIGRKNSDFSLFKRGVKELSLEAINDVIDMITEDDTAIYRGKEHLKSLQGFRDLMVAYRDADNFQLFLWEHLKNPFTGFRNTVIGTLIQDLTSGIDMENAVKSFESKVAPHNYKRPKTLISKRMVENAMKTIDELDLRGSLERRHAKISDVSVNDIIFADKSSEAFMKDALLNTLLGQVKSPTVKSVTATTVSMTDFVENIIPTTTSLEVLFDDGMVNKLMSVTAPVHEGEPRLFHWNNDFSWSYNGNLADSSIKSRVKKAGGNVTAPFRVSLGWFNRDDLDIHVIEPNGNHINFRNKSGKLDVDMNAFSCVRDAVENVCWERPLSGHYEVKVHNFIQRENVDRGFDLEVECNGSIRNFHHEKGIAGGAFITALGIEIRDGNILSIGTHSDIKECNSSKEHWGIKTQEFIKVRTLMKSPNHWHDQEVGNAHWFFILDNCLNPDPVRGMYNENLRNDLHEHRKVFEVLASKTMCPHSEEQLSGVGFSSTQKAAITVKADGRTYNVEI